MNSSVRDAGFTEYAGAKAPWLRKVAYLLCGDWHRADDLVQVTLTKLFANWQRAGRAANLDGYARATLVNTFLAEQRSRWWRSVVVRDPDERIAAPARELAGTAAPPMRIDIDRARAGGLRRRRRRRAAIVVTAAAAVLTIAVAVPAVLRWTPNQVPTTAEDAMLVTNATFGWLPDSITRVDVGQGGHGDYVHAVNENADLGTHLWLSVRPGANPPKPASFGDAEAHRIPAAPINGQPAYWLTANTADPLNAGDAYLYWHANGKLVELHGYYLTSDDPEQLLLRVAAEVTVADQAVPLPLAVDDLPAGYRRTEITFARPMPRDTPSGAWQLSLFYTHNGVPLTIQAGPSGSMTTNKFVPNCWSDNGIDVCVSADPGTIKDHITVLGLDESNWR